MTADLHLTRHAEGRIRQRGVRERDLDLMIEHGTLTDDGVLLTRRDVAAAISEHRRAIAQLERLKGTALILDGATVLSVYRPDREKSRRMLRCRRTRPPQSAVRGVLRPATRPVAAGAR